MLAEVFLTPNSIADSCGNAGSDFITQLTNCLFPFSTASVVLICKLGGEEWANATARRIARISNPRQREDAMSLFKRIQSDLCVTRPAVTRGSNDEAAWIQAAKISAAQLALHKIVVSDGSPTTSGIETVASFIKPDFWEAISNPRFVGRDENSQESALRYVCAHSDWLVLRFPQIRGGNDDEIVTVKQILRLTSEVPQGFPFATSNCRYLSANDSMQIDLCDPW